MLNMNLKNQKIILDIDSQNAITSLCKMSNQTKFSIEVRNLLKEQ